MSRRSPSKSSRATSVPRHDPTLPSVSNLAVNNNLQTTHEKAIVLKALAETLLPKLLEKGEKQDFSLNEVDTSLWISLNCAYLSIIVFALR